MKYIWPANCSHSTEAENRLQTTNETLHTGSKFPRIYPVRLEKVIQNFTLHFAYISFIMTPETETRQSCGLDGLPAELIDMIVACIDPPSLAQLASTCQRLSEMLRSLLPKTAKGYALASEEYYSRYLTRNLGAHILDCPFVYRFQRFADTIIIPLQPLADAIEKGEINAVRGFLDAGSARAPMMCLELACWVLQLVSGIPGLWNSCLKGVPAWSCTNCSLSPR